MIIIGIKDVFGHPVDWYCSSVIQSPNISEYNSTLLPAAKRTLRPHFVIGVSLVMGFVLMFVVDQIANYCSYHGTGSSFIQS